MKVVDVIFIYRIIMIFKFTKYKTKEGERKEIKAKIKHWV